MRGRTQKNSAPARGTVAPAEGVEGGSLLHCLATRETSWADKKALSTEQLSITHTSHLPGSFTRPWTRIPLQISTHERPFAVSSLQATANLILSRRPASQGFTPACGPREGTRTSEVLD